MTPSGERPLVALAAIALVPVLGACGSHPSYGKTPVVPPLSSGAPNAALAPTEDPLSEASAAPTTSGNLSASDMPSAASLGNGWRTFAATAGADHEGFNANGTWVWGRTPSNAVFELLPMGCAGGRPKVPLPTPSAALSGNYINGSSTRAYATVFQFATKAEAVAFVNGFAVIENACSGSGSTHTEGGHLNQAGDAYTDVRFVTGARMAQSLTVGGPAGARVTFIGKAT